MPISPILSTISHHTYYRWWLDSGSKLIEKCFLNVLMVQLLTHCADSEFQLSTTLLLKQIFWYPNEIFFWIVSFHGLYVLHHLNQTITIKHRQTGNIRYSSLSYRWIKIKSLIPHRYACFPAFASVFRDGVFIQLFCEQVNSKRYGADFHEIWKT